MQIEIKIDVSCEETKVIIETDKVTEEVNTIIKKLSSDEPQIIVGTKNGRVQILDQANVLRIYSGDKKVFAVTDSGEFAVRLRLYELEEKLDKNSFVRISNSEIVNIKKVKDFDLSFTGTICVTLLDGTKTYVSRRYVGKIKQLLGV